MEKPDRQEFTREFGARAAAKYATAMRNYRKFLKKQPKPNPKAASEAARIASAMKNEVQKREFKKIKPTGVGPVKSGAEYARALTKGKSANLSESARSSKDKPKKPSGNSNAKSEAKKIATAMKREVNTRKSQKVTDAMKRDANKSRSKSTEKPKTTRRARGSGVKRTNKKIDLGKALQNLSDKFKLTRKDGEKFTVGNIEYISDGKGGIRGSRRRQF